MNERESNTERNYLKKGKGRFMNCGLNGRPPEEIISNSSFFKV